MNMLSWRAFAIGASLVIGAGVAHAQTSSPIGKGSWIVSGAAGISHNGQDGVSEGTNFFLSPSGLYFVRPKLAVGGTVSASYSTGGGSTDKTFGIGPEIRYFAADLTDKTLPFVRATVRPLWGRFEVDALPNASSSHQFQWEVGAGLTQLLATHVGLTGELYYNQTHAHFHNGGTTIIDSDVTSSSYGLRIGITAFVF